ncbi:MAG: FAD-binding oxidoreductase [Alphaproteobacteria bacterium]
MAETEHVLVIGAGIIGTGIAASLQREGHKVTIIDRLEPGRACSFGNGGGIGVTSIPPLSTPGVLWKIPRWLLHPEGPLALRWSHLPVLLPWLARFLRAGSPERVKAITDATTAILAPCYDAWAPLFKEASLEHLVRHSGVIHLYADETARDADRYQWRLREERGLHFERLGQDELRQLVPGLAPDITCAMYEPQWRFVRDPYLIVKGLADHVLARGGTILREDVRGFELGLGGVSTVVTDRGRHKPDRIVIAAGAWSHRLSRMLGHPVPLESQRGYHVTMPNAGLDLRHIMMDPGGKMGITPMAMGVRFGGTSEFAGVDAPPDYRRAHALIKRARRLFPNLDATGATEWAGDRPLLPDSLPVIGPSPRHRNVVYAFGHSHIGMALGGITGKLVAELVAGRPPSVDLAPYRIDRF